jgi:hypothetical protein
VDPDAQREDVTVDPWTTSAVLVTGIGYTLPAAIAVLLLWERQRGRSRLATQDGP